MRKVLAIIFMTILLLTGCSVIQGEPPQPEKGVFNLESWSPDKDGTVKLDGEWEFYWGKLLDYENLKTIKPDVYEYVPSTWNTYSVKNTPLQGEGYGTYRLHVKTLLPKDSTLGLRIYNFSSAYRLYVNDSLVGSNGKIGVNSSEETGEYRPQAVFFRVPSNEFDIIIQVSNFHYARGGFWYSIFMGSPQDIMDYHDLCIAKETLLLGALIIISLFFFTIYMLRKELKYALYFACFCFFLTISLDLVGQFLLVRLFPGLSFEFIIFLWYSASTWLMFFLILYVHELFKSGFSYYVVRIYFIITIASQVLFSATPTVFYTKFANLSDFLDILGSFCTVIIIAVGIKKGYKDGWLNLASMVIVVAAYIHDDLYWTNMINSSFGEVVYAGLFLFILIQMAIQAKRIKDFHDHKVAAELKFLQAQIKPHFLFNAINTFISLSFFDINKARNLLTDLSCYLRRSFDVKDISQFVPIKNEIELAGAYAEIEKARFEERLEVNFDVCDDFEINVPILILQPVVENAIIHGVLPKQEGGRVDITIQKQEGFLVFRVRDNGVGMNGEKIRDILNHKEGVGLSNIDSRLKKLYGEGFHIESAPGLWTEVSWSIPIRKGRKK